MPTQKKKIQSTAPASKIYRISTVAQMFDSSKNTIIAWSDDPDNPFPQRISIGPRMVGFVAAEIDAWLEGKIKQREVA
jgi:predicted DNA-binding transcriptional regulator AlpA